MSEREMMGREAVELDAHGVDSRRDWTKSDCDWTSDSFRDWIEDVCQSFDDEEAEMGWEMDVV